MNTVIKLKQIEIERFEKGKRITQNEDKETDKQKVRVFYVPPGVSRVFDTKVKDEIMLKELDSSLDKKNGKILKKSFQLHQRF